MQRTADSRSETDGFYGTTFIRKLKNEENMGRRCAPTAEILRFKDGFVGAIQNGTASSWEKRRESP